MRSKKHIQTACTICGQAHDDGVSLLTVRVNERDEEPERWTGVLEIWELGVRRKNVDS